MGPTSKHLETAEIVVGGGGNRPVPAVGTASTGIFYRGNSTGGSPVHWWGSMGTGLSWAESKFINLVSRDHIKHNISWVAAFHGPSTLSSPSPSAPTVSTSPPPSLFIIIIIIPTFWGYINSNLISLITAPHYLLRTTREDSKGPFACPTPLSRLGSNRANHAAR